MAPTGYPVGAITIMIAKMIQDAIPDTAKVITAALSTTAVMDFLDGWGKLITWVIGTLYVTLKCIEIWRKLDASKAENK